MKKVAVTGSFDDFGSTHVRFLDEASKFGDVHVLLWPDSAVRSLEGHDPKFPAEERLYVVQSMRYVRDVKIVASPKDELPVVDGFAPDVWVVGEAADTPAKRAYCKARGLEYRVLRKKDLDIFPAPPKDIDVTPSREKVVVTGCYDWFHSGHVRFFEEVSELGDLYVIVGHDANIRLLKGEGHPMFPENERRYVAQAVRFVKQALISSGTGWMDAEPEILRLKPQMYAVNEDGDKPDKRAFCEKHGIRYVILKRTPKEGLPRRQSTALRGF